MKTEMAETEKGPGPGAGSGAPGGGAPENEVPEGGTREDGEPEGEAREAEGEAREAEAPEGGVREAEAPEGGAGKFEAQEGGLKKCGPSDDIVALLWARSETALEQILHRHGGLMKRIARQILPAPEDVEECVNDALLDIWNTVPPVRPYSLESYAVMLTRRRAVDRLRDVTAKKRGVTETVALDELKERAFETGDFTGSDDARKEAIDQFLDGLSAEDRRIFVGRYFAFDSIETLAQRHGVTKNTINVRLTRMRKKLKAILKERRLFYEP